MVSDAITISRLMESATAHHGAGRLPEAEALYRQVLSAQPRHPDALHLLGLIAGQVGRFEDAEYLISEAILATSPNPAFHCNLGIFQQRLGKLDQAVVSFQLALKLKADYPQAHYNLGLAWREKGRIDQAVASYQKAVQLKPDYAEALNNLGNAWSALGEFDRAIACYQRALTLMPGGVEIHRNLGNALKSKGQIDEAISSYQRALTLNPNHPRVHNDLGKAWSDKGQFEQAVASQRRALELKPDFLDAFNDLGNSLKEIGRLDEAIACYERALVIEPGNYQIHNNLGVALTDKGQIAQAIAAFQQALALKPEFAEAYYNLGNALKLDRSLDRAIISYQKALAIKPDHAKAHNNLGNALKDIGQMDQAIACYRQAMVLKPDYVEAHNNLLFAMLAQPACDAPTIFAEAQNWNRRHAEPLRRFIRPHENSIDPDRRLRIGYVSADFRKHPVGRLVLPLFAHHDRQAVDVYCYAQLSRPDEITAELRSHVDHWRSIVGLSDEGVAEMIREDKIDILVDLAMHTANNRLLVFARKPAPVQVSYLGYAGSAALEAIDYHLTDQYLEPETEDPCCFGKVIRLDGTYWCYQQSIATGPVNELPALKSGRLTLGCLNNFSKVTPATMEIWAGLLRELPNSQLLLYSPEGAHRDHILRSFADRVEFIGHVPHEEYFAAYRRIDIALDTFPYAGGTTTCDALWMGVPVVTLAGQTAVGRAGVSILTNAGLPKLIAHDREQYARIVTNLAGDLPRLAELRRSLRQRIQQSSLMNAQTYARGIENAFRIMWRNWCAKS
jgi:protein O-GlcNAc transferase